MFEDTENSIPIVRSLAFNSSIQEIGFDPTVRVLSESETQRLNRRPQAYLSAMLPSGSSASQWCKAIGPPIWTSLSFFGNGTNIWCVYEYVVGDAGQSILRGDEMIVETVWRSSAWTPESDIYMPINRPPKGLAKFMCSGDVGYPITLRSQVSKFIPEDENAPVPHRFIVGTIGCPIWEYTSERDLLTDFRDALEG